MFIAFFIAVVLAMLAGGAFCLWQGYSLLRGRARRFESVYAGRGVPPEKIARLRVPYAVLFAFVGLWLLALPACIVAIQIPLTAWAALILGTAAVFSMASRSIDRRHGVAAA